MLDIRVCSILVRKISLLTLELWCPIQSMRVMWIKIKVCCALKDLMCRNQPQGQLLSNVYPITADELPAGKLVVTHSS